MRRVVKSARDRVDSGEVQVLAPSDVEGGVEPGEPAKIKRKRKERKKSTEQCTKTIK